VRALTPEDAPLEVSLIRQPKLVEMYLDRKRHPANLEENSYLVSVGWWNWWVKICDTSLGAGDAGIKYTMEPVDNSSLVDPSTRSLRSGLKPALNQGAKAVSAGDFVYVPRTVWESCFERWWVFSVLSVGLLSDGHSYQGLAKQPTLLSPTLHLTRHLSLTLLTYLTESTNLSASLPGNQGVERR